tara:strand:- start:517 stop:1575 length:1059 start_codon:yes stop_codon:yes gene_type:complete
LERYIKNNLIFISNRDIGKYVSYSDNLIIDIIKKLDLTEEKFQVILEKKTKKVLGTLTDGDIRRILIKTKRLEDSILKYFNTLPVLGKENEIESNIKKINIVDREPAFLPIVNDKQKLKSIIIRKPLNIMPDALLLAGGLGTRLGILTKETPKPLLKIKGKEILEHCLEKLEKADIKTIYVSLNYLGEKIEKYISKRNNRAKIVTFFEDKKLGTVGPLSLIKKSIKSSIIVMNSDLITTLPIKSMVSFHRSKKLDGTIAAALHEIKIPYGILQYNKIGKLNGIEEKPILKNLVAAGVYILNKNIINLLKTNIYQEMPKLIDRAIEKNMNIGVFPIHEKWQDIGNPKDYYKMK